MWMVSPGSARRKATQGSWKGFSRVPSPRTPVGATNQSTLLVMVRPSVPHELVHFGDRILELSQRHREVLADLHERRAARALDVAVAELVDELLVLRQLVEQ